MFGLKKRFRNWLNDGKEVPVIEKTTETKIIENHHHHHYPSDQKPVARQNGSNLKEVEEVKEVWG